MEYKVTRNSLPGEALVNGDNLEITIGADLHAGMGVADVPIQITGYTENSNYDITAVNGTYKVVPREITVAIANVTNVYGNEPIDPNGGPNGGYTLTRTTFPEDASVVISGDGLMIKLTDTFDKNAGEYIIDVASWSEDPNYHLNIQTALYTIEQRKVTVAIENKESFYSDELAELTYAKPLDMVDGDVLKIDLSVIAFPNEYGYLDADTYAIVGAEDDPNYEITFSGEWSGELYNGAAGIYTVKQATNEWLQHINVDELTEGESLSESNLPTAKFGTPVIEYYLDEELTQKFEGDISRADEGEYYLRVYIAETKNYTGLIEQPVPVIRIFSSFIPRNRVINIAPVIGLLAAEVVILTCGLIFCRRPKNKKEETVR